MPSDCYSLQAINNHPFPLDNRPKKYYQQETSNKAERVNNSLTLPTHPSQDEGVSCITRCQRVKSPLQPYGLKS